MNKNKKLYKFYKNKVIITGHTGFVGSWLTFLPTLIIVMGSRKKMA